MAPQKQIRLYHLFLFAFVTAAYLTGDEDSGIHRVIGYTVAGAISLRLVLAALAVGAFKWRRLVPSLHAPAGLTWMKHPAISRTIILLILAAVAGTATTGVLMDKGAGLSRSPFADIPAEREDYRDRHNPRHGDDEEEGVLGEVHEILANLVVILVGAHVAYLLVFRLPVAKFMAFLPTGKRRSHGARGEGIT